MTAAQTAPATISESNIIVRLGSGDRITFSGSGNIIEAGTGTNTLTDDGGKNTFILPTSGQDVMSASVLKNGDTFDLTQVLKGTTWSGDQGQLSNYLKIITSGKTSGKTNDVLDVRNTTMGSYHAAATIDGAGSISLRTFLAHAIT